MDTYEYVTINPSADRILLIASELGIRQVAFGDFETVLESYPDAARTSNDILADAGWQIFHYLQGELENLEIPLDIPPPSPYQNEVLEVLQSIPYGHTKTYTEVAQDTGRPRSFRAVGNACRANPVPIIIPCHRVVPANGTVGGYIGGTEMKELLLHIENSR